MEARVFTSAGNRKMWLQISARRYLRSIAHTHEAHGYGKYLLLDHLDNPRTNVNIRFRASGLPIVRIA